MVVYTSSKVAYNQEDLSSILDPNETTKSSIEEMTQKIRANFFKNAQLIQYVSTLLYFYSINHFQMNINESNALIHILFSCINYKLFFHLTANGYENFDLIISSFNRGLGGGQCVKKLRI